MRDQCDREHTRADLGLSAWSPFRIRASRETDLCGLGLLSRAVRFGSGHGDGHRSCPTRDEMLYRTGEITDQTVRIHDDCLSSIFRGSIRNCQYIRA